MRPHATIFAPDPVSPVTGHEPRSGPERDCLDWKTPTEADGFKMNVRLRSLGVVVGVWAAFWATSSEGQFSLTPTPQKTPPPPPAESTTAAAPAAAVPDAGEIFRDCADC